MTLAALTQDDAASSLLSLSFAAASAPPIPIADQAQPAPVGQGYPAGQGTPVSTSLGVGTRQHRRLASTGKARRRLSDARDAANRPSPALLQSAAALSLASLSLSTSPPAAGHPVSSSLTAASNTLNADVLPASAPLSDGSNIPTSISDESKASESTPNGKNGRKRGVDHKCESCSKIYRHPSCLIKHRWEHTPHWREASKFVLSKHQQVQLLEAAAILSHLSPSTSSLPDDRSLWPSFLSGGSLPKADTTTAPHHVSSSVPANAAGSGGITQLRPGLVGVPTAPRTEPIASQPVPVPNSFRGYRSSTAESWSEAGSSFVGSAPFPTSSVARSSLSASSQSRSRSGSASGSRSDDDSLVDVDEIDDGYSTSKYAGRYGHNGHRVPIWKREEDEMSVGFSVREEDENDMAKEPEWDGMDMDMDMD
ncbi:hypothetical protein C0991_008920 [Blastosporella zonata]|nr:hypothetical protein C0991_008920 [Blastosporella zonata]